MIKWIQRHARPVVEKCIDAFLCAFGKHYWIHEELRDTWGDSVTVKWCVDCGRIKKA